MFLVPGLQRIKIRLLKGGNDMNTKMVICNPVLADEMMDKYKRSNLTADEFTARNPDFGKLHNRFNR